MAKNSLTIIGIIVAIVAIGAAAIFIILKKEVIQPEELLPGIIDCETNLDCFIKASRNCDNAKVIKTSTTEEPFRVVSKSLLEIKGAKENKCILYLRLEKMDIQFTEKYVQYLVKAGLTLEQIRQVEQENKEEVALMEGKDGICKFKNNNDLVSFSSKWREGKLSGGVSCKLVGGDWDCTGTGDWAVAECEGEIFTH